MYATMPPRFADKKNVWISDDLEWLKQYDFDLGDSLLIVSALKPFIPLFPFFLFAMQKIWGGGVCVEACSPPPTARCCLP